MAPFQADAAGQVLVRILTPARRAALPRQRVLVVDDDYIVREELLRALRGETGVGGVGADGADAALLLLASAEVDLVVLDLLLPDRGAWRILERLGATGPGT